MISFSYAEDFDDVKVLLKMEKYNNVFVRGENFFDTIDYENLKKRLTDFCLDSAEEMLLRYDKLVSYVVYKINDLFLPVHSKKKRLNLITN